MSGLELCFPEIHAKGNIFQLQPLFKVPLSVSS